jgi:hypothetical protein
MIDSQKLLLYSVNILLSSINELSIADDTDLAEIIEARKAVEVIEEVKKAVLSDEWDVNTDDDWEFVPDIDGYISLPANILDIATNDSDIIMRDWRLYSKKDKTAKLGKSVKCKVVWDMDFNALPYPIRHYITIRASRIYQYRMIGDVAQFQFSDEDENKAYLSARRSDGRTANYNMLTSGSFGQEFKVRP